MAEGFAPVMEVELASSFWNLPRTNSVCFIYDKTFDPHCHTLRHQEVSPLVVTTVAQQQLRGKKQQLVFAKHHILLNALLDGASYSSTTEAFGHKTCNLYSPAVAAVVWLLLS